MRGKAAYKPDSLTVVRITPAYAGKRHLQTELHAGAEDHPRLCGEKRSAVVYGCSVLGSPPPMRGKVLLLQYHVFSPGITPAYAGKRLRMPLESILTQDHPRLCGEKGVHRDSSTSRLRITPAYAGKRDRTEAVPSVCKDHPRLCGEK